MSKRNTMPRNLHQTHNMIQPSALLIITRMEPISAFLLFRNDVAIAFLQKYCHVVVKTAVCIYKSRTKYTNWTEDFVHHYSTPIEKKAFERLSVCIADPKIWEHERHWALLHKISPRILLPIKHSDIFVHNHRLFNCTSQIILGDHFLERNMCLYKV